MARERGPWVFPGGGQWTGEDIASTAILELDKETGRQVSSIRYLFQFQGLLWRRTTLNRTCKNKRISKPRSKPRSRQALKGLRCSA
ncbi:hypothetical protein [Burkholderia sp. D-99]|uniref:hypothetical protein n=1 Tax=Burkholderia sp. D-99 TaxID=2717316 RepID=UPI00387EABF8